MAAAGNPGAKGHPGILAAMPVQRAAEAAAAAAAASEAYGLAHAAAAACAATAIRLADIAAEAQLAAELHCLQGRAGQGGGAGLAPPGHQPMEPPMECAAPPMVLTRQRVMVAAVPAALGAALMVVAAPALAPMVPWPLAVIPAAAAVLAALAAPGEVQGHPPITRRGAGRRAANGAFAAPHAPEAYFCRVPDCHFRAATRSLLSQHSRQHALAPCQRAHACTAPGCSYASHSAVCLHAHEKGHLAARPGSVRHLCPVPGCGFSARSTRFLAMHTMGWHCGVGAGGGATAALST